MLPYSILQNCSEFLSKSKNKPLIKFLPEKGDGFRKIKVRKKNNITHLEQYFDEAFESLKQNFSRRVVVAHSKYPTISPVNMEPFYIFPTNGFKIIFNTEIMDYYEYVNKLHNIIPNTEHGKFIIKSVIKESFVCEDLAIAHEKGHDVLVYNIKNYYAIRTSLVDDYENFLTT